MKFTELPIQGVYSIDLDPKSDNRGYFMRIFCQEELKKNGITFDIRQMNHSFSVKRGTLRGMHRQNFPKAEQKIVQCLQGNVYEVILDLRKDSPTYLKWCSKEIKENDNALLYIPEGCALGFQTLSDNCLLHYAMSEFFYPEHAQTFRFDDPSFKIEWPLEITAISDKDRNAAFFNNE